jgi:SPP1 gp7 family putative phage head morphogenesis protein
MARWGRRPNRNLLKRAAASVRELFASSGPSTSVPAIPSRSKDDWSSGDYNPDPLLKEKGQGLELFDRMMLDDCISGTMDLKKRLVLSADWEIKAASNSAEDMKIRDFVKENFETMEFPADPTKREPARPSFLSLLDNLLDARVYGFKVAVPHLIGDAGLWRYDRIICKPSYDIQFHVNQETDQLDYLYVGQSGMTTPKKEDQIDPSKVILFVWPYVKDASWYGRSDLSQIYREFFSKEGHVKFRNKHGQKFGSPTVVAEYRSDLSEEQLTALKSCLNNWQDDLVVYIPSDWHAEKQEYLPQAKVYFLEQKQNGQAQYNETIEEINKSIRRKELVPDMAGFTDVRSGSRALGESQFSGVMDLDTRVARFRLCDCINAQGIAPIVRWNFGPDVGLPKLTFVGDGEGFSKAKAEAIAVAKEAEIIKPQEKWIRPYLAIPESDLPEGDEEIPGEVPPPETPEPPKGEPEATEPVEEGGEKSPMRFTDDRRFNAKQALTWYDQIEGAATPIVAQALAEVARASSDQAQRNGAMNGDWDKIEDLKAPGVWKKQIRDAYQIAMGRMYFNGRVSSNQELHKARPQKFQDVEPLQWPEWGETDLFLDRGWIEKWLKQRGLSLTPDDRDAITYIRKYAFRMAGIDTQKVVTDVGTLIYTRINTMTTREIVNLIEGDIAGKAKATAETIVRNNASEAFNNGRMTTFRQAGDIVQGYVYDAILDGNETDFCHEQDGRYIEARDPMFVRVIPPNHDNCRSVMSPILQGEEIPAKKWLHSLLPSKRFGG